MSTRRSRLETEIHDLVAGDLDEVRRAEVERLVSADADARALFLEVTAAHDALTSLRDRPEPPVVAADALPHIQAAIASAAFERKPKLFLESGSTRFYRRAAMAATVLLALTAGLFFATRGGDAAAPVDTTPAAERPAPPSPAERGLERFVDAGRKGGIDAVEWLRMLREAQLDPNDVRVTPMHNVVPVGMGDVDER